MSERERRDGARDDDLLFGIGDLVRDELPRTDASSSRWMRRRWKPAPAKIAALAASVAVVAAGIVLLSTMDSPVTVSGGGETELAAEEPGQEAIPGRIALVTGGVRIGERTARVGDHIEEGDVVETAPGGSAGIQYDEGPALMLGGSGRLEVASARGDGIRIDLHEGLLAARIHGHESLPLTISGSNAEVRIRGTLITVRAESGRIVDTAVSQGEVEVLRRKTGEKHVVARGHVLDLGTWTAAAGQPDGQILERLALMTGEPLADTGAQEPVEQESEEEKPATLLERIQKALDSGDVDGAISLIEKHGAGQESARFHMLAGEAYRAAARWSEAADAYMAAAEAGKGKQAERALLRAASIQARKLARPAEAASIIDGYMERFPEGSLMDEALYLGGVAHAKSGNVKKARALLERYLEAFPSGPQATRVHLTLAKLLAMKMSDCKAAGPHLDAVMKKAKGTDMAGEAAKIAAHCSKKEAGE